MRHATTAALPRSAEAFSAFFLGAPWPMHLVDAQGTPGVCNPALVELLGLEDSTPSPEELLTPEAARQLARASRLLAQGERDFVDRALTYLHASGTPIRAARQRLIPLEREEGAEPTYLAMLNELVPPQPFSRATLQSRMAQAIAHDFNNVFTVAASYVDLVRHQVEDDPHGQQLERALRACRRGIALVDALQLLTSLDGLPPTETDLNELLERQQRVLSQTLSPGPKLHVSCEEDLPILRAHPSRVGQLVADLVANALMRWPQASRLELSARHARAEHPGVELTIGGPDDPNAVYEGPFWPMLVGRVEHNEHMTRVPDVIAEFSVDVICDQHAITAFLPAPTLH
ncbi:hypothetical protein DV096_15050 [Bradymonadaceae bacterium TMQ3]|uniref:Signal transduction histidine kinase dimerisation/phosphoacceptor domain-containing protein n=1 Tax=Lujinxingia sediminis TaxID=2480984 RepID=A0ABY0CUS0_9DELT|nr:hypothetical protein [Lujinxingia sediminis]RDV37293.1 hypothetical protein DV096_15050 [Bradymonadaceae bacterium TMQ3]RVU46760.1 hypothetical protein EA187_06385 [Lujinxingia sediminis]TXC74770.1 hypothetical protein FRC91_14530 [Bradymonadales bacterium TMQ1]